MDVHDISEGDHESTSSSIVLEKLERLRANLRRIGQVAFRIDDILHCLSHCSEILQRNAATMGKVREGDYRYDDGVLNNLMGLLDTYDEETKIAHEMVQQQLSQICNGATIDESCSTLADIDLRLNQFADFISEPHQHKKIVESVRNVCDTSETIKAMVGGNTTNRPTSSRSNGGSTQGISSFFVSRRSTRSSGTGVQKHYGLQLEDSDSDRSFGLDKKERSKRKKKDSDDDFTPYCQNSSPSFQPNPKMRSVDAALSSTIDTGGSQEEEFDDGYQNLRIQETIQRPRPVASTSTSTSKSHSGSKGRSIPHTHSQDDPDSAEVMDVDSPVAVASKATVLKKLFEPGATRNALRNITANLTSSTTPVFNVATKDEVISIDDENSNDTRPGVGSELRGAVVAMSADEESLEGCMIRTDEWQAVPYGDNQLFKDQDKREAAQYLPQAGSPPTEEDTIFHSDSGDDSEGSASREEVATALNAAHTPGEGASLLGMSSRERVLKGERSDMAGDVKTNYSIAAVFSRAAQNVDEAFSEAFTSTSSRTPHRNHIREEKRPTPCTSTSTATMSSSAEPKQSNSWVCLKSPVPGVVKATLWPDTQGDPRPMSPQNEQHRYSFENHQPEQKEELEQQQECEQKGTGTQSDSEASTSQRGYPSMQSSRGSIPQSNTTDGVSRERTGPGHAARHHPSPLHPPPADMLGSLGAFDVRFSYAEDAPDRNQDNVEEQSQEWMESKGRKEKRPLEQTEVSVEEGKQRHDRQKEIQANEIRANRTPIVKPPVIPPVSPAALSSSKKTKQCEDQEDVIDLT